MIILTLTNVAHFPPNVRTIISWVTKVIQVREDRAPHLTPIGLNPKPPPRLSGFFLLPPPSTPELNYLALPIQPSHLPILAPKFFSF